MGGVSSRSNAEKQDGNDESSYEEEESGMLKASARLALVGRC